MTVPSNENVTERRGGQGGPARERGRLDPLTAFGLAAHSFLSLGRRPALGQCPVPEGGQAPINLFAQQQGIGLLIERLQSLLLLLTEHSRGEQTLIGRLGFIPFAPHLVPFHRFFALDASPAGTGCSSATSAHRARCLPRFAPGYPGAVRRSTAAPRCRFSVPRGGYHSSGTDGCARGGPPSPAPSRTAPGGN